ncbi:hypothetical protein PR202_gb06745 [Eleusine coracana subsp. coracana]|uniref:RING-type E3 ubiquitin transferase n=1 Tax=Eleusine coracana subsp. coracana TaxID=191504 RepID=A0AAV5EA93_ELECO|nr:hypothetical protein QOZ80_2BG0161460 [Eleusine coracana subsp. coracana]GJN19466.1 hypothetical protein PR202_gb06745 [Eleusine coracana subsp. coracana]
MLSLYSLRISSISGAGAGDDDDYGEGSYEVFGSLAMDACAAIVTCSVLAACVIICEACAFAAMAALLVGAVWSLLPRSRPASMAEVVPAAASVGLGGLTDAAIDEALPASPYGERRRGGVVITCSVCLEDVRGGEMVRSMPECRHLFHVGCIDVWLHAHPTCPLCRSDLSPRQRRVTSAALSSQVSTV